MQLLQTARQAPPASDRLYTIKAAAETEVVQSIQAFQKRTFFQQTTEMYLQLFFPEEQAVSTDWRSLPPVCRLLIICSKSQPSRTVWKRRANCGPRGLSILLGNGLVVGERFHSTFPVTSATRSSVFKSGFGIRSR